MKIISKFHDYYDIGLAYGQDDAIVYVREKKEVFGEEHVVRKRSLASHRKPDIEHFAIGFCGKIYPFVRLTKYNQRGITVDEIIVYHADEIDKVAARFGLSLQDKEKGLFRKKMELTDKGEIKQFLVKSRKTLNLIFQEHKVPVFLVRLRRSSFLTVSLANEALVLNPNLGEYKFYKAVDAYTAYQELEMYIGGVLGGTGPDMAKVEDEFRYAAHGYDKESFRMPKGRKKQKKK